MAKLHQSGEIINQRYKIASILGKGGVGITYSAIDLETNSTVAIKAVSLRQLDDWKQVELFEREASVLAKLDHPNIPKYLDYFDIETEKDKVFYIVQQQAPGKSLFQLVESGWRTTEVEVKQIAEQVLSILIYLHSLDPPVIHRDIKPHNLICSDDGRIFLVDFGAVQNTYYDTLMQGSTVVGTYGYMAPEQFRGKAEPATDLYSLGATILYLLTHRSPAELPQNTLKLDFKSQVNISKTFADWLEKILEIDTKDRFSSAQKALIKLYKKQVISAISNNRQKLIVGILTIILGICATIFHLNKWVVLGFLRYHPIDVCNNPTTMRKYLSQGGKIDINVTDFGNDLTRPLLVCAIGNTDERLIKVLKGKKINNKNSKNYDHVLLFYAISQDDFENIKYLIKKGVDINIKSEVFNSTVKKDNNGFTPLHAAVKKNNIRIVQLLIDNGANINAEYDTYPDGIKTPLSEAVNGGYFKLVKLLIYQGADTSIKIYNDKSILDLAKSQGQHDTIQLIEKHITNK